MLFMKTLNMVIKKTCNFFSDKASLFCTPEKNTWQTDNIGYLNIKYLKCHLVVGKVFQIALICNRRKQVVPGKSQLFSIISWKWINMAESAEFSMIFMRLKMGPLIWIHMQYPQTLWIILISIFQMPDSSCILKYCDSILNILETNDNCSISMGSEYIEEKSF